MNTISPTIPLILGIAAGALFLILFVGALVVTMRNRRIIRRNSDHTPLNLKNDDR